MAQDASFVENGLAEPQPAKVRKVNLNYNPFELRALRNMALTAGAWAIALLGAIPLFSVIYMLIGNSNQISLSLFSPANTLAALLASNFPEAAQTERQALMYAALVLLAITLVVNVIGTLILIWTSRKVVKA